MPGFYAEGEYDLAGFIVGAVARDRVIDGSTLAPGDVLVGLPSTGLHTNGYSLARRIVFEKLGLTVDSLVPGLHETVGDAMLRVHRSYLSSVAPALEVPQLVRALAHITGGGITDNLPRALPEGCQAVIDKKAWQPPPLFEFLAAAGQVPEDDMYRSFNMGIGLVIGCRAADTDRLLQRLGPLDQPGAMVIGEIVAGERRVVYR
jgi:phosphoribosylformylglycinamidine cyclo-ligase